jgi:hypothetical protein
MASSKVVLPEPLGPAMVMMEASSGRLTRWQ